MEQNENKTPGREMTEAEKLERTVKDAVALLQETALQVAGQGSYEVSGRINMACQLVRVLWTELEKSRTNSTAIGKTNGIRTEAHNPKARGESQVCK